jgi:plasmid stabilization system protein ParE
MTVIYDSVFVAQMVEILRYIANDNQSRADYFQQEIEAHLQSLPHFPYKFRQSIHYDDPQIRDYVFKGYTIPYLIDETNGVIVVLDIFKWTK